MGLPVETSITDPEILLLLFALSEVKRRRKEVSAINFLMNGKAPFLIQIFSIIDVLFLSVVVRLKLFFAYLGNLLQHF